ncbi:MAG: hypothetical protein WA047_20485 [Phenylobacterium sp.]|uniref:hypothetical protein n=1 Tax=Phenylobacterium sp. TaxID=1871053 RepID=UPI003BB680F4
MADQVPLCNHDPVEMAPHEPAGAAFLEFEASLRAQILAAYGLRAVRRDAGVLLVGFSLPVPSRG